MPTEENNVLDKREQEIKKQAREILEKFAKALEKVEKAPESFVERDKDRRKEGEGNAPDNEFINSVFENAPQRKGRSIQAERGAWK